jgi:formamidopyrimidine-DNA glycosylase
MVEGHSVHRIASRFRSQLVGKRFTASSPNGRFTDGARAIDGKYLSRMEAVGKNLFAFFNDNCGTAGSDNDEDSVVVHVHFGLSGAWAVFNTTSSSGGEIVGEVEPEVKPTTRLRLEEITTSSQGTTTHKICTHLSAMTVAHGNYTLYSVLFLWKSRLQQQQQQQQVICHPRL